MTSAIKTRRTSDTPARGFTLLEIIIVLLVIALIGGGAIGMMALSSDERALSSASVEVEALAKRARTVANLQQRPYALEFFENRVRLMPWAEASLEPGDREGAAAALEAAGPAEVNRFTTVRDEWAGDEDSRLFLRRWASEIWIPIDSKNREIWRFDPEGFCEPVSVRIQVGKSWAESEFNPLTASIRETTKEIY